MTVLATFAATFAGVGVRPGAAELLIGIECFRVRDSSWMYLISLITTRIGVELAAVQNKLPGCIVVGLQMYSARTFHVTPKVRYPSIQKVLYGILITSRKFPHYFDEYKISVIDRKSVV